MYGTDSETTTTVEEETTTEPETTEPETTEPETTEPETTEPDDEEEPTEPVVPKKTYTFKDENVSSEIEYSYKVVAVATKSERESSESEPATCFIKTLLDKLTGIKFEAEKAEPLKVALTISWDEVRYAEKYVIRRYLPEEDITDNEAGTLVANIFVEESDALSCTDNVRINREYIYKIIASAEDRGSVTNVSTFCWTEVPPVPADDECLTIVDGLTYFENGFIVTENSMIDDLSILLATQGEYTMETELETDFFGTGETIDIYLDGYKLKTYTLIVKGDIYADGICDTLDLAELEKIVNGHSTVDEVTRLAADMNNDGNIDSADLELLEISFH